MLGRSLAIPDALLDVAMVRPCQWPGERRARNVGPRALLLRLLADALHQADLGPRIRRQGPVPGNVEWSRRDHFFCRFRRSSSSTLNGTSACSASNSAPPAAENTDKLSGAFTPNATVIARPKVVRRTPLNKATRRVRQPRTRRRPKSVSAAVAIIANAGIIAAGKTPIELGRIVHEPGIVAPRHIGLSINAPEAKPVCDDRQERDPQSEAEKYRAERRQSVHRGP